MIEIISSACIALMAISALIFLYNVIRRNRASRITYIRSFKRGKGAIIYLYSIPLFWVGLLHQGESDAISCLFHAIKRSVDLIMLGYDTSPIQDAIREYPIYRTAIYICFSLAAINGILLIISFASQYLWHYFEGLKFRHSNKDRLILFGNNSQNRSIYLSDKKRSKIIIGESSNADLLGSSAMLYKMNILNKNEKPSERHVKRIMDEVPHRNGKSVVIINTNNDLTNITICNYFVAALSEIKEESKRALYFNRLKIFTFGDPKFETIYENIVGSGHGCISYINKYRKAAIEAIEKHPFSLYLTENHVDYATACIREGFEINALLIGFGKTNQQFFLTSVANNQFITQIDGEIVPKPINYHLFDHDTLSSSKKLNHNYNRYKNEFGDIANNAKELYLPLPAQPANTTFHKLDINAEEFYTEIRHIVCGDKRINFIVIAFGSDLENIDMAQKLASKFKEWETENFTILVKVRSVHSKIPFAQDDHCHIIDNEDETIYNIDNITSDNLAQMAQARNAIYEIERKLAQSSNGKLEQEEIDEIKQQSYKDWYMRISQLDRESSAYCCLSLRSKLNLIGLDYCPITEKSEIKGLTEKEYLDIYGHPDSSGLKADNKQVVNYPLNFEEGLRKNLAIHEHLRWNAFMISKGIVPASKKTIAEEKIGDVHTNGKNIKLRRHGCLTTYKGLEEYRMLVVQRGDERKKPTEEELLRADVIKYDYQLMDDAHWLLTNSGYKIISKQ